MKKNMLMAILFSGFAVFVGCIKDKEEEIIAQSGTVKLKFEHIWGESEHDHGKTSSDNFALNTELTHPKTTEKITVSTLKYYISNVKFKKTDGTWWSETESYHLIDLSSAAIPEFTISSVPAGDYIEVSYTIGVDSAKNVSGSQTGALSTSNNMFWNSSAGYIFIKMEGKSPVTSDGAFFYHIGGYKTFESAIAVNSHDFENQLLSVLPSASPSIHFNINVANIWSDGVSLFSLNNVEVAGENAQKIAHNFSQGFTFNHIHN